ncbi:MAG: hypothetical protein WBL65_15495 [Bryobacteraceae bacterium]
MKLSDGDPKLKDMLRFAVAPSPESPHGHRRHALHETDGANIARNILSTAAAAC